MRTCILITSFLALAAPIAAQDGSLETAADNTRFELQQAEQELTQTYAEIADAKLPLVKEIGALQAQLTAKRKESQEIATALATENLKIAELNKTIETQRADVNYIFNRLLGEYLSDVETGMHIAELQTFGFQFEEARLALDDDELTEREVFARQLELVELSIARLHEALGGRSFDGRALDEAGLEVPGKFLVLGPNALFASNDGKNVGTVEERSLQPAVLGFNGAEDTDAARALITSGHGDFPLDTTLGQAVQVEATEESFFEHVQKGGPIMVPIGLMAVAALLVALFKWLSLTFQRKPSRRKVEDLLEAVRTGDQEAARARANRVSGPVGSMLAVGVEHMNEPRELIEETMYESVLTTKLAVNRYLPFIAISAASAPLLGLLGTVTGIINTFKMITLFGSGDVKSLSGGISEALITTKFGLVVAIPSLLLHAFLSRKARGVVDEMEKAGVSFVNEVARSEAITSAQLPSSPSQGGEVPPVDPAAVRAQVKEILGELLGTTPEAERTGAAPTV